MRNPNKYYRNKHAKQNARRRAFAINGGEFAYRSYMPFMWSWSTSNYDHEEQLQNHIEFIENHWARTFLNGNKRGTFHAPKWLKKSIERAERHNINQRVNQYKRMNVDDIDDDALPTFKHHADWDWF
jgi:hypothetical protein